MGNINKSMIMGNLTRDPSLNETHKGVKICQFGVATHHNYINANGVRQSEPTFIECKAWGAVGEAIYNNIKKGQPLYVEGRIEADSWTCKKTGQAKSVMNIVVSSFEFINRK